ncbi:MAG: hypothetical protein DCF13_00470 [Flavobacteriaceae bacterium]|nr:MAG: hypothetical protein DCF13_00470 [Flavobacteriaceae bacterium]
MKTFFAQKAFKISCVVSIRICNSYHGLVVRPMKSSPLFVDGFFVFLEISKIKIYLVNIWDQFNPWQK